MSPNSWLAVTAVLIALVISFLSGLTLGERDLDLPPQLTCFLIAFSTGTGGGTVVAMKLIQRFVVPDPDYLIVGTPVIIGAGFTTALIVIYVWDTAAKMIRHREYRRQQKSNGKNHPLVKRS